MKNPFTYFWQRQNQDMEFLRDQHNEEKQMDAQTPLDPYEEVKRQEREHLMLGDEAVQKMLLQTPSLRAFVPALAGVNRTTKHISKSDALVAWLNFKILFTLEEMCMDPVEYEQGMLEIMQGLEIYADTQISDGYEGWKGRILTEQKKIHVSELRKGK